MPAKYGVAVSGLFATFVVSVVLEAAAIVVGLRGSIFERSRRKQLPFIIYANFVSHLGQLGFNCKLTRLCVRVGGCFLFLVFLVRTAH